MIYESRVKTSHSRRLFWASTQWFLTITLCLGVNLIFSHSSYAFKDTEVSDRIRFHSLTIEDGLTQSTINTMSEDRLGYMWFGTQDGLNRYDGTKVNQLRHDPGDSSTLASAGINKLIYDAEDTMWVLMEDKLDSVNIENLEVTHWTDDIESLAKADEQEDSGVLSIALMGNNQLFIVTESFLAIADIKRQTIRRVTQLDSLIKEYEGKASLVHAGRFYFLQDSCLVSIDIEAGQHKRRDCLSSDLNLKYIFPNRENRGFFFVGGDKGFATYDSANEKLTFHPVQDGRSGSYKMVLSVLPHKTGYWLATDSGLKYWNSDENAVTVEYFANFSDHYSINNDYGMDLWKSSGDLFWLGTLTGVNYWKSAQQFVHLLQKREVMSFKRNNYTTSLLKTYKGELWIGTDSSGIYTYDKTLSALRHIPSLKVGDTFVSPGYVAGMIEDRYRNLWIITKVGIFFRPYGKDGFSLIQEAHSVDGRLLDLKDLSTIIETRDGDIWLGGLKRFYEIKVHKNEDSSLGSSEFQFIDHSETIPQKVTHSRYGVYTIYEDLQGYIWLGSSNGLVRYNPITSKVSLFESVQSNPQTLSSSDINVIYEDLLGVLWIGTISGLNRVRFNSKGDIYFQRVTEDDGFIDDYICSILSDSSGYLWISTANGLIKYHPEHGKPVNFSYEDGLQYNEFFTNADFSDNTGNLYFGGINGISMFNPDEVNIIKDDENLEITAVKYNGQLKPLTQEGSTYLATVGSEGATSIQLSAFDFIHGQELEYRYKMDALANDWITIEEPVIYLHSLNREQLLIRVQVRQKNSQWGDNEAALLLSIKKTFWASSQGLMLYLIILSAFVIGVALYLSRYFAKRLARQQQKINQRKAQAQLLLSEKKNLLYQVEDLQYSLSEQRYLAERLQNQLESSYVNDRLTGFKSQHYLKQHIRQELENIVDTWIDNDGIAGVYLGVFAVDIDNLAMINKEHGQLCGDEILKQAAECLRTISYGSDTLVRWQGATLLILSRGIEKREQMIMAEKIRSIIASRKFDLGNGASIDVTCSVGFGRFPFLENPKEIITWQQLIYVINRALKVAKYNSRNAWLGIYTNQFSDPQEIRTQITQDLGGLLASGQLDYVSSIPKSNKIHWDTDE